MPFLPYLEGGIRVPVAGTLLHTPDPLLRPPSAGMAHQLLQVVNRVFPVIPQRAIIPLRPYSPVGIAHSNKKKPAKKASHKKTGQWLELPHRRLNFIPQKHRFQAIQAGLIPGYPHSPVNHF